MFEVGTNITIELPNPKGKSTCISSVLGWKQNKYVILDVPTLDGKPVFLHLQRDYIFRYIYRGYAVGFRSSVLGHVYAPHAMTLIRYPNNVEKRPLRAHPRYGTLLEADFKCEGLEGKGTVLDLSLRGCLLEAPFSLLQGRVIVLTISLPEIMRDPTLIGTIRSVIRKDDAFHVGVAFYNIPGSLEELLNTIAGLHHDPELV